MFRVDDFPKLPRSIPWGEMEFLPRNWCNSCGNPTVAMWIFNGDSWIHQESGNLGGPSLVTKVAKAGCIPPQMPGIHEKSQI